MKFNITFSALECKGNDGDESGEGSAAMRGREEELDVLEQWLSNSPASVFLYNVSDANVSLNGLLITKVFHNVSDLQSKILTHYQQLSKRQLLKVLVPLLFL